MNFFDHKDLGNHLLQLCPKVVKHPVYVNITLFIVLPSYMFEPPRDLPQGVLIHFVSRAKKICVQM